MPGIIWTKPAVQDVQRLIDFVKAKNPTAARKAAQKIRKAASILAQNPHFGKPMEDETDRREFATNFGKRGYVLRYMIDDNQKIIIIRVWHSLEQRG